MATTTTDPTPSETLSERSVAAFNSLTHGGRADILFILGEDPAEFFALLEAAFQQHQPTTAQDSALVTDSVLARWWVLRRHRVVVKHEDDLRKQKPDSDLWTAADLNALQLFDRYKIQAERSLKRALANLLHIRKDELTDQRWRAQHQLQKERFALECERFELAKQREARMVEKRAKREEEKLSANEQAA